MSTPTVSVVLPTLNRAALLPRALDSIIAQTHRDWEIVVVDDGSNDATPEVLQGYASRLGDRLVVVRQGNEGSSSARNAGIAACRGRFVAFLDSDDEYVPSKLERQLDLFRLRPELGFVFSDYAYIELDGTRHDSAFDTIHQAARRIPFVSVGPGMCVCTGDFFDHLIRRYFIATIVGMVRRDVLGRVVRFAARQSYAEEWLFFLRVAKRCCAGFVDEPLCIHHHTAGSLARSDRHSNTVRFRNLLKDMTETFDDLTRSQRRTVRLKLADTYRQLGYDAYRVGDYDEARVCFGKSLSRRPSLRVLVTMADAFAHAALARLTGGRRVHRRTPISRRYHHTPRKRHRHLLRGSV